MRPQSCDCGVLRQQSAGVDTETRFNEAAVVRLRSGYAKCPLPIGFAGFNEAAVVRLRSARSGNTKKTARRSFNEAAVVRLRSGNATR